MIEKILPLVNKPSRYTNSEWNSAHKQTAQIKVCFCFPDLYELGASNLGIEILYGIVNSRDDSLAERCFCPEDDMRENMTGENIRLFSLEEQRPLKEFDIVGFSLQYELCFTNVLSMLDLAAIPLFSKERVNSVFPLVIAGGPVCANPEPGADFFDLMVLGEGEDVINEIIDVIKIFKSENNPKTDNDDTLLKKKLLVELARIEGVYVPSLFDIAYNVDGAIRSIEKNSSLGGDKIIKKRTVDIKKSYHIKKPIVPNMQTVHNRYTVEVSRGCTRGCRFCQAVNVTRPWRERDVGQILGMINEGIDNSGYEEISLLSFSISDYSRIEELLREVSRVCLEKDTFISIPSIRCNPRITPLLKYLVKPHRTNLTFAIETVDERLQKVIGKKISGDEIIETIASVYKSGWKLVKLYFMYGLPTEKDEDLLKICELVWQISRLAPNMNINITLSPFIPKSHTPLQFAKQENAGTLQMKQNLLRKRLKGSVKGHNIAMAVLEGVFARGDRRLSEVIFSAWKKGCRFDNWKEKFRFSLWEQAFRECDINMEFYMRERNCDEILPWEHIDFGRKKEVLYREYRENVLSPGQPPVSECKDTQGDLAAPVREEYGIKRSENISGTATISGPLQKTIYRMRFSRKKQARFIAHNDQIQLIRRVIRRAKLPVSYSGGFHPQQKLSFGPAISVGYESESEYVDVELSRKLDCMEIAKKTMKQLPGNYSLMEVREVPGILPSLESAANVVSYDVFLPEAGRADVEQKLNEFMSKKEVLFEKRKKNGMEIINVRPLIFSLKYTGEKIEIVLRFGPKKNIKPEMLCGLILGLSEKQVKLLPVCRKAFYRETAGNEIVGI